VGGELLIPHSPTDKLPSELLYLTPFRLNYEKIEIG